MTDNEKLQMWQLGAVFNNIPDYPNDDSAAMSLLDTLVKKGYEYELLGWLSPTREQKHLLCIAGFSKVARNVKPTRREAVVVTVLEVIEKEGV